MFFLRKCLIVSLGLLLLGGCGRKKKPSLTGEDPVEIGDFIAFFQPLTLPFVYADSTLKKTKKEKDSLLISYKVFSQFVPDTILGKVYGRGVKPRIYALGKTDVPRGESYLFVKSILGEKKAVFILSFDRKQQFIAGLTALRPDPGAATQRSVTMDKKYTITKSALRRNENGSLSEGRDVYVLNGEARSFMLIMTDALEDKPTELMNPIDTLPRKNKFSADYGSGKMNLVSIRDGRNSGRMIFFIHFEKNNGECSGELKGDATFRSANTAEYSEGGDPCKLKFIFTATSVTLKEEEGCGSHRPLKCSFDGSFPRKKEIKLKTGLRKKGKIR